MEDVRVSFEVALLLKEKRFNEPTLTCYRFDDSEDKYNIISESSFHYFNNQENKDNYVADISAPAQSVLQRWLREKYDIHIIVVSSNIEGYNYGVVKEKGFLGISPNIFPFETYEEALEQALLEGLQMI